jgi:hypothetical protein
MVSMLGHGTNPYSLKILPASDCAPRITSEIPAKRMIPIGRGGGGTPSMLAKIPFRNWASTSSQAVVGEFISGRNPQASPAFEQREG